MPSPGKVELEDDDVGEAICRICFLGPGEGGDGSGEWSTSQQQLVSPCKCEGSQKYVHLGCLRRWQRSVQLGGSNHPEERACENRHLVCNVCKTPFDLPPQDRSTMMAELAGIAPEMVTPGVLLITKRTGADSAGAEGARLNLALRAFLESKAAHFREAVYVLTEIRPARELGDGSDAVLGVNLSRRLEAPPELSCLKGAVSESNLRRYLQRGVEVLWMNGGPVEPRTVTAMCSVQSLPRERRDEFLARSPNVWNLGCMSPNADSGQDEAFVFCGSMDSVLALAAEEAAHSGRIATVLVWAGFAQWSRAQLLGEMARGSWGWCRAQSADISTAMRAILQPHGEAFWNGLRHSSRLAWAPDNEVAREFEARFAPRPHMQAAAATDPQAEDARALVQQFEALLRGSTEAQVLRARANSLGGDGGGGGAAAAVLGLPPAARRRTAPAAATVVVESVAVGGGGGRAASGGAAGGGGGGGGGSGSGNSGPRCLACAIQ